jgi:hypothetical protein
MGSKKRDNSTVTTSKIEQILFDIKMLQQTHFLKWKGRLKLWGQIIPQTNILNQGTDY